MSLQTQASTGKKFTNVSDDPTDAMAVIADTDQYQLLTTHLNNIQWATTALNTSVSALQQVNSIFNQATSIAIEASNSNNDTSSFGAMAQQVNGLINSLLTAANTQNNGVYVFSGSAYNTEPYVVTSQDAQGNPTAISYQGSSGATSTIVNNNQSVPDLLRRQQCLPGERSAGGRLLGKHRRRRRHRHRQRDRPANP